MDIRRESFMESVVESTPEFLRRIPPHSKELEQAVLGAIMQEPLDGLSVAQELITNESFYYESHQIVFDTCLRLHRKGVPCDAMSVIEELRARELLSRAGGESYIYALVSAVPDASAIESHTRLLHEKYLLRKLIQECNEIVKEAYDQEIDVTELLDKAEREILQLDQSLLGGRVFDLDTAIREFINSYEIEEVLDEDGEIRTTLKKARGMETGYPLLDKKLGGLKKGDLIIVAARPGVGKTALILNFAYNMALKGKRIGIFSMEMSKEQLALRFLSMATSIPSDRLDQGNFTREEIQRLTRRYEEMANLPIFIDDSSVLNIRALRNRARRMFAQYHLDIVFVDYLQLMEGLKPGEGGRVQEVTEISRGLKQIARELEVPVVACSQLSRQVEHRSVHRPILSDLRESGSLEQDADVVILMYREDYYDKQRGEVLIPPESAPVGIRVELNVAKHRNGPTGFIYLTYLHPFLRFESYTGEDVPLPEY